METFAGYHKTVYIVWENEVTKLMLCHLFSLLILPCPHLETLLYRKRLKSSGIVPLFANTKDEKTMQINTSK